MLKETERRRKIQLDYNQQHKITPQPIIKPILANPITKEAGQEETRLKMQSSKELEASIKTYEEAMYQAAQEFQFDEAAKYRDLMNAAKKQLLFQKGEEENGD